MLDAAGVISWNIFLFSSMYPFSVKSQKLKGQCRVISNVNAVAVICIYQVLDLISLARHLWPESLFSLVIFYTSISCGIFRHSSYL